MTIAARLDDLGKPAWIALMIAGFFVWWPIGLVTLGFLVGSGRIMGCWTQGRHERWQRRMQEGMERAQQAASEWGPWRAGGWCGPGRRSSSGNRAFDEYRAETLRRLEDEQRDFFEFLNRLRQAKDKAEFDQFMAERGRRQDSPPPQQPQP
ncbi:MAG: DUF2852 domain-containing protein [Alphaproteobacteria bacterium]|nr:DUF2852 domain-containing protein [Alphaproteobacteria bacterium]MBV9584589.1 DUF2852 domain-containing protein [Alphaproteobacteria bacterium]MBV9966283.1 DUF2852 domain-containing protein [Alphaproteobacteria bacterium]